jgi:large subunit ribosomal protein L22
MSKKARERSLADNEAKAVSRMLRVSPQKLNLLAQLIRGKKVAMALADLEFSRKRIASDVRKCLESAIANAENNHDLDVDDLVVAEAHVGKSIVIKRHSPRARGRVGTSPSWCAKSKRRPRRGSSWVRRSIRSGFVSASTAPGIRGGMPAREATARCCTRT